MKILLFGKNGQLGWELQRTLACLGQITALDYEDLNLMDSAAVRDQIQTIKPAMIVNASAYTAVDRAETEQEKAFAINGQAPGVMARSALETGACLIHFSTDYVFDGSKGSPYLETDKPNPLNVYGKSKLEGENQILQSGCAALIFRTSWVYSLRRDSFVTKTLEWSRKQSVMRVVDDQVSNPTWARALAEITANVIARGEESIRENAGLYHLGGDGYCSRLEWSRKILELDPGRQEQIVREILPAATTDFPTPAVRPLFSAMDTSRFKRAFSLALPPWQDALRLAML